MIYLEYKKKVMEILQSIYTNPNKLSKEDKLALVKMVRKEEVFKAFKSMKS